MAVEIAVKNNFSTECTGELRVANIVITGCSSGFGYHAALAFARNGDRVLATMRNVERAAPLLQAAADKSLEIHAETLDVTCSKNFPSFFASVEDNFGAVDVLVNNAGILRPGALEDLSEAQIREVMETNVLGPLLLTRSVLPYMRQRKRGYVIMVSSLSGIAGLPGDVSYTASKFALEGATEALRHEVDRWNIRLALVQAGMYATNIVPGPGEQQSVLPDYYPEDSPYRLLIENNLEKLHARAGEAFDPATVAQLLVKIAHSDGSQLRWPADDVARMVLGKMLAQDDSERDSFLRQVADSEWWSEGTDPA